MADAQPGLFDDPAKFGLTPAKPADAPASTAENPDFQPARLGVTPVPVREGIDPLTNRPYQYAGNVPPDDPVGQSTGKPISEDRAPGIVTQAAGSLATDPEQKRRIIAGQLFPNLKPSEAQARVFYGLNGRMAAVGPDGQPYYVDPDKPDISAMHTFSPANLASNLGTLGGPALPAAGGLAGGVIAGPTDLLWGPLAAGAGAAAGDAARQHLAGRLDPGVPGPPGAPPTPMPYNWRQTVAEGAGAAAGQLAGTGFVRALAPNPLGVAAYDLKNLNLDPSLITKANAVYNQASAQGVTLLPGQASGLPSLLGREDVVASGAAGSAGADAAKTFYTNQRQQVTQAYQDYLGKVSPAADKTDAALQAQQGIEDAQRIVRQQANAAARPAYQTAQAGGQVMSPDLAQLSDLPAMQDALKAAAVDYQNRTGKVANTGAPDFDLWNIAKQKLDDAVGTAKRAGEYSTASSLDSIRSRLLTNLDAAYPSYEAARAASAPGQRLAARMESALGRGGTGDETTKSIVAPIFNQNNPRAISEMRDAFIQAGRGDEWNAATRAYMQDTFDNVIKSQEGLNPSMLRKQLWSDPNRREAMQAAMTPAQFQGFQNLMETVERVAQSKGMNSLTAPRLAGAEEMKQAAAATPGVAAARIVGTALSPSRLMQGFGPLTDKIAESLTRREMGNMGERLFSGTGMDFLNRTGMMAPGSRRLTAAVAEFLGQQAGGSDAASGRAAVPGQAARDMLMAPRNRLTPIY